MIHEGDPIALRRDARVIQVACGFIEHLADGIRELILPVDPAHHREFGAIRRPVGLLHIVEQVTRRAAIHGHAGQRAMADEIPDVLTIAQDRHFVGDGDRQHIGVVQFERARFRFPCAP